MEMLSAEQWAAQQASGTWSELFSRSSLINSSEVLTVFFWLTAFWLLGVMFMPLTAVIFRPLKDKGWGISKFFGLMVWGFVVWLGVSFGMEYSRKTLLIFLAVFALINTLILFGYRKSIGSVLKRIKKDIFLADAVFFACFFFFLAIRIMNPDLWHPYKGGERPMDFSYFNAILKSSTFPPYDPWFEGGFLNYYYYGIYLSGVMVKLLGVIPSVAFNLNLALWYGFLGSAAFCIGKTLYLNSHENGSGNRAGLFTVIGMQFIGNLGTVVQIKNELIELGMSGTGLPKGFGAFLEGLRKLISGEHLIMYKGDWYWIPSRAIPDSSITEFPFFTFLYGDPHAHLFALPMTLLVLIWLTALILRMTGLRRTSIPEWLTVFISGAMLLGVLYPSNTWDYPSYMCVAAVVILYLGIRYGFFQKDGENRSRRVLTTVILFVLFAALTMLLVYPYISTNVQENQVDIWKQERTPISSFFMHWGVFLFFIGCWYILEIYHWMKYTSLRECREILKARKSWLFGGGAVALMLLAYFAADGVKIIWIVFPYMTCSLLMMTRKQIPETKRFVFLLVEVGMFACVLVEMVHLIGDNGRMNVVFKFYNQAWIMFSICAAYGLASSLEMIQVEDLRGWGVKVYRFAGALLVCSAFMYTVIAGTDKMTDRMSDRAPHTLDGMKYMETSSYWQDGFYMDLSEDYYAILWMQENIEGSPVIVEASPTEYKFGSRYTIYTGLPGVVGWNYHQRQQRGPISNEVWNRVNGIHEFYNTTDLDTALEFLAKYNVKYIIVGQMEKGMYDEIGVEKFETYNGILWRCVYDQKNTQIYEVM